MTRSGRNPVGAGPQALGHLVADNKKAVLAGGLVVIMLIMWVRLLTGSKPDASAAATSQTSAVQKEETPPVKVRFSQLPVIEGRNDRIRRDFFSADAVVGFRGDSARQNTSTDTEVRMGTDRQNQEVIARVAQKLRLEAVMSSENPRAFINDRLLGVGETLSVRDGATSHVFEVLAIQKDSVLVGCNGKQVTLKLSPLGDAIE